MTIAKHQFHKHIITFLLHCRLRHRSNQFIMSSSASASLSFLALSSLSTSTSGNFFFPLDHASYFLSLEPTCKKPRVKSNQGFCFGILWKVKSNSFLPVILFQIFLAKNLVRGTIRLARAAICLINPQAISRSFSVFFSFSLFVLFF